MSRASRHIDAAQERYAIARAQSKLAEDKWRRAAWRQGDNVALKRKAPSPSPAENSFRPHQKGQSAPDSIASRLYPHLLREGK